MNISDILSIAAIVISVISLSIQRKSSNQQLVVANFSEYTRRYQDLIGKFPSSVIRDDFDLRLLSEEESEHVLRCMWIYFDLCYEEYFLYKSNFIDVRLWKVWREGIKTAMSRPAFQQSWTLISSKSSFSDELGFKNFMNTIVQLSPNVASQRR